MAMWKTNRNEQHVIQQEAEIKSEKITKMVRKCGQPADYSCQKGQ